MIKLMGLNIPKKSWNSLQEIEKTFFIQLTHLLNEINILQKCTLISSNNALNASNAIEKRGHFCQTQFFLRMLAGKLKEGWEILQKDFWKAKLSKNYEKVLSKPGQSSLEKLKKYFGGNNNIKLIRKKFAFHYDSEKIKEIIDEIPQSEVPHVIFAEHRVNCLYSLSDIIVNWAILFSIEPTNPRRALETLIDEIVIKVSGYFQEFGFACIEIIVNKLGLINKSKEIRLPDPPSIDDINLPYFVKKA